MTETERFWSKVSRGEMCWTWLGATDVHGYGKVKFLDRTRLAHRVSWLLTHGDPGRSYVCHHCDTPSCVRPDHLFVGEQLANIRDMDTKGRRRSLFGIHNPRAKLTHFQVGEIRRRYSAGKNRFHPGNARALAEEYGVSKRALLGIIQGVRWSWL